MMRMMINQKNRLMLSRTRLTADDSSSARMVGRPPWISVMTKMVRYCRPNATTTVAVSMRPSGGRILV